MADSDTNLTGNNSVNNIPPIERPIGMSLLALMTMLVAMLALMLAFSLWLRGQMSEQFNASVSLIIGLTFVGMAYAVQATGLWLMKSWTRLFTLITIVLVTVAAMLEVSRNEVLALGTVLVFCLGFIVSMVSLIALHRGNPKA